MGRYLSYLSETWSVGADLLPKGICLMNFEE